MYDVWLPGGDSNPRPRDYEPRELPLLYPAASKWYCGFRQPWRTSPYVPFLLFLASSFDGARSLEFSIKESMPLYTTFPFCASPLVPGERLELS